MEPNSSQDDTVWGGMSKLGLTQLVSELKKIYPQSGTVKFRGGIAVVWNCDKRFTLCFKTGQRIERKTAPHNLYMWLAHTESRDCNGMACHFPGLKPIENVWQIMKNCVKKILPENFRMESYNHGNVNRFWSDLYRQFGRQYAIVHRSVSRERYGGLSDHLICAFWTVLYSFI